MNNKIIKIIFLQIIIMIILPVNIFASNSVMLGDINSDGKIDSSDILLMLRHITSVTNNTHSEWELTNKKLKIADLNEDRKIDVIDVLCLQRYIVANNSEIIQKKHPDWIRLKEIEVDDESAQSSELTHNNIDVTNIIINKPNITLEIGKSEKLMVTISPKTATNKVITWISSNKEIALVDSTGKVSAKKNGTAIITATSNNGKKAECKVTVETNPSSIKLENSKLALDLSKSKTATLKASIFPKTVTDKSISWISSNTKVATVNKKGKITAKKNGTVLITAKTNNGKKAICKVTIKTSPKSIDLNKNSLSIALSEANTAKLKAKILPTTSSNKTITWLSSNTKIATIDKNGVITAKKSGTLKIIAKTSNGKKGTCTVTVYPKITTSIQPVSKIGDGYSKVITFSGKTFKLYSQHAGSYSGTHYHSYNENRCAGCSSKLTSNGCGPTAAATVLSGFGFNLNPGQVATKYIKYTLDPSHTRNSSGMVCQKAVIESLGLKVIRHDYSGQDEYNKSYSELKDALSNGHQVIIYIGLPRIDRHHFICALAIDTSNDYVFIGDAGGSKWQPLSQLVNSRGSNGGQWSGWIEVYK